MKTIFRAWLFPIVVFAVASSGFAEPLEPILKVAGGFAVERLYVVPRDARGSWISLCADRRGVLYASDQYGPLYRIQLAAAPGGEHAVDAVKLPIGGVCRRRAA